MRAIVTWRGKYPERKLTLPDHADMVIWLLERLDNFEDTLKREITQNLPKALEIERVRAEVAKGIFEEIEKMGNPFGDKELNYHHGFMRCRQTILAWKSKYTGVKEAQC